MEKTSKINETLFAGNCIRTYTGLYMDVFNPTPEMICIEDIAHALSHLCRFAGHTKTFYSVAQHSIMVAECVPEEYKLSALLHDASEAYLLDMPRPIKQQMPEYKKIEERLSAVIHAKFELNIPFDDNVIKDSDMNQLRIEHRRLMLGNDLSFEWPHLVAKMAFLEKFQQYSKL